MNITTPDSYLNDASIRKRRPGRPKGSGKKVKERILPKRPVGRPRRDGLPSGSVNFRPKRVIVEFDDEDDGDWAKLLHTEPDAFLSTLVITLSSLPPPASSGPSAEEVFKSHLKSLAPTSSQNQHLPSLYSLLKTFWIPTSPAYFSLTASASSRTLSDHRFFYWDPQPLVINGISCPSCSAPLANEGRIKHGPLKIYDVERPFFVIGAEYVCKSEGKTYASTDPSILRALPQKLRDELPAKLDHADKDVGSDEKAWCWKPSGVSKTLWNLVLGCVQAGLKKDVTVKLIRSTQKGVEISSEEQVKAGEPDQGFTDTYGNAWSANAATIDEEHNPRHQEPEGSPTPSPSSSPPPSYGPLATSSGQIQSSSSFGSTPFQYADYDSPRLAPTPATLGNMTRTLHNTVSPISSTQSQSSLNGAMGSSNTLGHGLTGPGSSPPLQLLTPSTMSSRLSPLSSAATPILTPAVVPVPTSSSSSIAQGSSHSPPFPQTQASPPSRIYDYTMAEYPEQQPSPQRPQITQIQASHLHAQPQPQPQIQVHNQYQQTHASLSLAQLNYRPNRDASNDPLPSLIPIPMANSPHNSHRADNASALNGNISSSNGNPAATTTSSAQHITTGVSILQHIANNTSSNILTRAIAPIPVQAPAPTPVSAPVPTPVPAPAAAPAPLIPPAVNDVSSTDTSSSVPRATSFVSNQRQRTRNPRHCSKCGSTSCKGKGGRNYCTSACKDCGRFECRGRNSRRPDKNCVEGWV